MYLSGLATDLASCALAVLLANRPAPIKMLAAVKAKGLQIFFVILIIILNPPKLSTWHLNQY
jgi:hypothetical protein